MAEHMLTTVDNPFNPFNEFDAWRSYDESRGYHTIALLARIITFSNDLSEADQSVAIENAIEEIVFENVSGMHTKITADATPRAAI